MSTSVLEMPHFNKSSADMARYEAESVEQATPENCYSTGEIDALHRDDAMTSAAVAMILGCAFTVLLCLTVGVSVWMIAAN